MKKKTPFIMRQENKGHLVHFYLLRNEHYFFFLIVLREEALH